MSGVGVEVILDIHEPEVLYDLFMDIPEVESVRLAALPTADIVVGDVGFERKTWGDYVSSMMDGRLDEQTLKMEEYDHSYVLIEGDMSGTETLTHTQMPGTSIRGHMASLTARDISAVSGVIPCSTSSLLADYAVRLGRKHTEDPTTSYLPTGAVGSDEPTGKRMWGCVEGVGPELADRLYGHFGSPVQFWVHYAGDQKDSLMTVDGVGEEKASAILEELVA